ncbi:hypothetical protein BCV09_08805 [Vibrio cyclitrophicus]|uniref:hypothetical protein n=1 Tax=Vibrio TaxID=662 RepID=UPI00029A2139|nr:hypothetical protein [Vibrio cyclitrophicus]OBT14415.1 hypothetical protein A9265_05270 [Vibrio cyclitrophicus]OEE27314.1 hypothetical protein OAW_16750 [Vibrio cyclitrophicus ZF170]OEE28139.1 hypothetical protein OAM_02105 [Vibrio cyclitrophicus ZF14]PMF61147.1 hypothetical protein BCV09_17005 [Vibrio cyclitrophicus]
MESKIAHLQFIQDVITRMNSNSFLIKGWATTLIAAILALAADNNPQLFIASYIVSPIFWFLDGFFLSQERKFRKLYDHVRTLDKTAIDFNMNPSAFNSYDNTWLSGVFSDTLVFFYLPLIAIVYQVSVVIGA